MLGLFVFYGVNYAETPLGLLPCVLVVTFWDVGFLFFLKSSSNAPTVGIHWKERPPEVTRLIIHHHFTHLPTTLKYHASTTNKYTTSKVDWCSSTMILVREKWQARKRCARLEEIRREEGIKQQK